MQRVQKLQEQVRGYAPTIVVLGSCFMDYIAYVPHQPQAGETMPSQSFVKGFGGKGANQAVAAGRLGAATAMVGMLGSDGDGDAYAQQLQRNGVDTTHMLRTEGQVSGLAMIFVDAQTSNNTIVICPNVTALLTPALLRQRTRDYDALFVPSVRYLICQNEVPLATTLDVLRAAHERGIYTILNAAPAPTPEQVAQMRPYLRYVSLFCPNEVEAAHLTGITVTDQASAAAAITAMQRMGIRDVVITLGPRGFILSVGGAGGASAPVYVAAREVRAVDTTGAGDCFVGTMAYFLSRGHTLLESCKRANVCAGVSVTRKGTQASYPTPSELPRELLEEPAATTTAAAAEAATTAHKRSSPWRVRC